MDEYIITHDYWNKPHLVKKSDLIARSSTRAIIIKDNHVLLVTAKRHNARREFPGGGVEDNESEIQALKREVHEETGLNITGEPVKIIGYENYYYSVGEGTAWNSYIAYYTAEADGDLIVNDLDDDVVAVEWVELPLDRDTIKSEEALVLAKLNPDYIVSSSE